MGQLSRRLDKLETALPPLPYPVDTATLPPEQQALLVKAERIVNKILAALPASYRASVENDLRMMAVRPMTYENSEPPHRSYYWDRTISRVTDAVIDLVAITALGDYTGPLAIPEIVCEMLDHRNGDKVFRHGHVLPPGFLGEFACPSCEFPLINRHLRETLPACPACDATWTPYVSPHTRSMLIGSREYLHVPADHTASGRERIGRQSVGRLGGERARAWLQDDVELPVAVVDVMLKLGREGVMSCAG